MSSSAVQNDQPMPSAPEQRELEQLDAYWRTANYLAAGMIYLQDNPLLREPLQPEHIKNRLLGHWGSSPGQAFIWTHANRLIRRYDLDMIYLSGPGHGAPGMRGPVYIDGSYSERYPDKSLDEAGLRRFFKMFSFPGHIGSHCTAEMPGSIHEGGELGYVLSHACGAIFDNPELIALACVGDGEAETGPLATSWHINKFINPARDGAVLPVLHLNGYKIANPSILSRIPRGELDSLLRGYGWEPLVVEGADPMTMHRQMAVAMEQAVLTIRRIQTEARQQGSQGRPRWPLLVLRSPKGWTGPAELDGQKLENFWRSTRYRSPTCNAIRSIWRCWSAGCAVTGPRSSSMRTAACGPRSGPSPPRAGGGWAPTPTPTAVCCGATWWCPMRRPTRCR